MKSLDLELEFLTPAFVGSADPRIPELRGASIRGHLRWWWRVGEGHRLPDPKALLQEESRLFGGVEKEARKSPVSIYVEQTNIEEKAGKRRALGPGTSFHLVAEWREGALSPEQERQFCVALARWIRYGGLGARSRKGFGALHVRGCDGRASRIWHDAQATVDKEAIPIREASSQDLPPQFPPFPQMAFAFSISLDVEGREAMELLRNLNSKYEAIRKAIPQPQRWVLGESRGKEVRRASSILLYVTKDGEKLAAGALALPCLRDERGDLKEAKEAWKMVREVFSSPPSAQENTKRSPTPGR